MPRTITATIAPDAYCSAAPMKLHSFAFTGIEGRICFTCACPLDQYGMRITSTASEVPHA